MKKFLVLVLSFLILSASTASAHPRRYYYQRSGSGDVAAGIIGGLIGGLIIGEITRPRTQEYHHYHYPTPPQNHYYYYQAPPQPDCQYYNDPYNPYVYRKICR